MANYTKINDFTAKDSLASGNINKRIRGSEFDAEFNAISTAITSKPDSAGVTSVSGTGTVNGLTLSGTVTSTGNLTLGGTLAVAADQITSGTLPVNRGGTGSQSPSLQAGSNITVSGTWPNQTIASTASAAAAPAGVFLGPVVEAPSQPGVHIGLQGGNAAAVVHITAPDAGNRVSILDFALPNVDFNGRIMYVHQGSNQASIVAAGTPEMQFYSRPGVIGMALNDTTLQVQGQVRVGGAAVASLNPFSCQIRSPGYGMAVGGAGNNDIGISGGPSLGLLLRQDNVLIVTSTDCYKGGSSTAWILASDARIKKNITAYTKGLVELNQIEIKNYEFNGLAGTRDGAKGIGVIADEIEQVLPETVGTNKVKLQPTDEFPVDLKHFDSTEIVYLLVNCVKELSAKVDAQAAEIAALKT